MAEKNNRLSGPEPYADIDVAELPDWWRRAIEHFERRGLGPYRPPRFADGTLKPPVQSALEAELDVSITLRCANAAVGDDWTVAVDGEPVWTVGRHRSTEGYTVFETDPETFRKRVREAEVEERHLS